MSSHAIQTDRLDLRTFAESDIPELVPLIGAREVAVTTLRIPHPYEERHAKEFLASAIEENELRLVIRLRRDGRLCGGISCILMTNTSVPSSAIGLECRSG